MNTALKTILSLGIGYAVEYFSTSKPFRTWLRKKAPSVDQAALDRVAQEGLDAAKRNAQKLNK